MTTYAHSHVFPYPWRVVAQAFWEKYPSPELPHVKDALVLSRTVDERGRLRSKRLVCVKQSVPRVLRPFVTDTRIDTHYAVETSCVDPAAQTIELETRNLSFSRLVSAHAKSRYVASEDGASTLYSTESVVRCSLMVVGSRVEHVLSSSSLANSKRGVEVMEGICRRLVQMEPFAPVSKPSPSPVAVAVTATTGL